MTRLLKAVIPALALLAGSPAFAQTDPTQAYVAAWDGHVVQVLDGGGHYDETATAAAIRAYVAAHPVPAGFVSTIAGPLWISKVDFERRLSSAEWSALDAVRLQVEGRSASWYTAPTSDQQALLPWVRPFETYKAAVQVNLADPELKAMLSAIAAQSGTVFGANAGAQAARVNQILAP